MLAEDVDKCLVERFRLEKLWDWQREAIEGLLFGVGRALVIAPTGGGKSLCYQLPAALLSATEEGGCSVVISPLIALMDDQVRALQNRGIRATYVASTLSQAERQRREEGMVAGDYEIVYVAPERLRSSWFVRALVRARPPLVAVDEAHCISQWGHDFRPDYMRLAEVIRVVAPRYLIACTATATPAVRDEIMLRLDMPMNETAMVLRGFARENLHLSVEEIDKKKRRVERSLELVRQHVGKPDKPKGAAIIYAGTRKGSGALAEEVKALGYRAAAYHAGREATEREEIGLAFAEQRLDVVVATNAFGMGIDRPDIRLVVHTRAPGSIEAYYQEVGRGGRDGEAAFGVLLSGTSDLGFRRRLIEQGSSRDGAGPPDAASIQRQWELFLELMRYIQAGSCRHDYILRYFGDEGEVLGGCGHCDMCELLGPNPEEPLLSEEDRLVVRKALSGVARLRLRAGMSLLADSLKGKDTARVRRIGLDQLSTHGLLAEHSTQWILALLRRLIAAGLVDVTPNDFPMPYLTPLGIATMKGEVPVRVLPPVAGKARHKTVRRRSSAGSEASLSPVAGDNLELFEQLRAERLRLARDAGVPAYVVCGDRSLRDMAQLRPSNENELLGIYGMGQRRIERYGNEFLRVIRDLG